jgi:hypothetical protein
MDAAALSSVNWRSFALRRGAWPKAAQLGTTAIESDVTEVSH